MRPILTSLLGAGAMLLPACGGGGLGGLFADVEIVHLPSIQAFNGYILDGLVYEDAAGAALRVGDNSGDQERRAFVRFDLSALPPGAEIVDATIVLEQYQVTGAPYATMGAVVVDHVLLGAALDATDFNALPLAASVGVLASDPGLGLRNGAVRDQVQADLDAARTRSDFRLRFQAGTDGDGVADFVRFNGVSDAAASGLVPYLRVEYFVP